jgi:hypothetical protein
MMRSAWRALLLTLISCAVLAGGLVFSAAQASAAGGEPTIVSESATSITEHGATLEAQIDPEGLETKYELWLEYAVCQPAGGGGSCEAIAVDSVKTGYISPGDAYMGVSVNLTNLHPNYSYTYWVFASNSAGWITETSKEFKAVNGGGGLSTEGTPLPIPENKPTPFEPVIEPWVGSSAGEGAAIELAKAEEARKAQEAATQTEAVIPIPKGESCDEAGVACEENSKVTLVGTSLAVQGDGTALVKLECGGTETCSGKLILSAKTTSKTKGEKWRSRTIAIGAATFSIPAGKMVTAKIALNATGHVLLGAEHGRFAAGLAIVDSASGPTNSQTKTVRLVREKLAETSNR